MVWVKGQSGNPSGRVKTKHFYEAVFKVLKSKAEDKFQLAKEHTKLDVIAMRLVKEAVEGNMPAIKEIADRLDGKPAQAIIGGDEGDSPILTKIMVQLVNADNTST